MDALSIEDGDIDDATVVVYSSVKSRIIEQGIRIQFNTRQ